MSNPHGSFVWYELLSPDVDGAKRFYDAVVGWTVEAQSNFPNGYRMIGRADGRNAGGILPLSEEMRSHGAQPAWLGYVGVDDVDATVTAMSEDGGKALMPPFDIPGVGRVALVADPQGVPLYVMRGASGESSDVFSVDQPQHVRWNELATTDPAGAIAFYARHFGWGQEGDMDMGEMGKYQFVNHGATMIGAVMPKMPQMPVSAWTYYIGVDDIDRAASAVRDGGGHIVQEPIEIPGGEYSLVGIDPQGAAFGLVGPRH
ncbi:VOC family protein [Sphingomonas mesophila]|uniref:VOC family protein n=1 Tax=Sphingomonas mesophila TaxID=2303576 RepID=UPI000E57F1DF|nr:VOC family protein [Sphingomonas mesophila]